MRVSLHASRAATLVSEKQQRNHVGMFISSSVNSLSPDSLADAFCVGTTRIAEASVGPAPAVRVADVVGQAGADGAVQPRLAGGVLSARGRAARVAKISNGRAVVSEDMGAGGARHGARRTGDAEVRAAQAVVQSVHLRTGTGVLLQCTVQ